VPGMQHLGKEEVTAAAKSWNGKDKQEVYDKE
jgi:hypothetical protein